MFYQEAFWESSNNEVPSERAGVSLELGKNRWLDLMILSSNI
jgi:hypothetical protein